MGARHATARAHSRGVRKISITDAGSKDESVNSTCDASAALCAVAATSGHDPQALSRLFMRARPNGVPNEAEEGWELLGADGFEAEA